MSNVNFLKLEHRIEHSRTDRLCGIVDGGDQQAAYTTTDNHIEWNATIENKDGLAFQFVPVDNNIAIYKANGIDMDRRCDGMLLVDSRRMIAFIELKDVRTGGFSDAIRQLKTTIEHFLQSHNYKDFNMRRAYVANTKHPTFKYSMKDEMENFRKLKFIFYPVATIEI